jgi:hypothetical protein
MAAIMRFTGQIYIKWNSLIYDFCHPILIKKENALYLYR